MTTPSERTVAEAHRMDDANWRFGVIYSCRADPRVVVRNRWFVGWTWNFGHPMVLPLLLGTIVAIVGPTYWLLSQGRGLLALVTFLSGLAIGIVGAHRIASGPTQPE